MKIAIYPFRDWINKDQTGSSTLRCDNIIKHWSGEHEIEIFQKDKLHTYDVLILQKAYDTAVLSFKGLLIVDVCDDQFEKDYAQACLARADVITASSVGLCNKALELYPNTPIYHIDDRHDAERFPKIEREPVVGKRTKALWFGYSCNFSVLERWRPMLQEKGISLIVVSDADPGRTLCDQYVPFSWENLFEASKRAEMTINPPLSDMKSDNKTTISWQLGLPCARSEDELEIFHDGERSNVPNDLSFWHASKSVDELNKIIETHKKPKRVLLVSHELTLTGAPNSLFQLAKGLKAQGLDVMAQSKIDGPLHEWYEKEGIECYIKPFHEISRHTPIDPDMFDTVIVNTLVGAEWIRNHHNTSAKIIWSIRESCPDRYVEAQKLVKDDFKKADLLVFCANGTRILYEQMGVQTPMETIYNGVDLEKIDTFIQDNSKESMKQKLGLPADKRIILTVGSIHRKKGQLDICAIAMHQPDDLFLIVGSPGVNTEYSQQIDNKIRERGLTNVLRIPATQDVFDYFRAADVYLGTSYEESFPRVILEAMAFSLPIVSTDVFGIPEAVRDGKEASLYSPGHLNLVRPDRIELAVNALSKVKEEHGINARARLEKEFIQDKIVQDYLQIV